jgi:hypothetical protein
MEPSTLHSVPAPPSEDGEGEAKKARREARQRPSKPLPTDRIKLDVQQKILQAIGRMSNDKKPIPNDRLSDALNGAASRYSVGLSHRFFVECGWLQMVGRGEYAATPALVHYSRRLGVAPEAPDEALAVLRAAVTETAGWFWPVIFGLMEHGPARVSEVTVALMTAAEVGEDHRPQVKMLIDWLRYIGLVIVTEDRMALRTDSAPNPAAQSEPAAASPEPERAEPAPATQYPTGQPASPDPEVSQPTTAQVEAKHPMLSFDFSFRLTAEDLLQLSPEQIRATFEAVGAIMAIKPK